MKNKLGKASLTALISGVVISQLVCPVFADDPERSFIAQAPQELPSNSFPPASTKPQIEIGKINLEVLDPGKEPKQLIRFQVPVNRQETAILVMQMDSSNTIAGNSTPPLKLPTNVVEMETKVTKVDNNGDLHVSFRYPSIQVVVTDDRVSPEVVKVMRTLMPKLTEVEGEFIIDERGETKSTKFSLPTGSDPFSQELSSQLSNSFNQLSSPFPEVAIGKGAKWRTTNSIAVNGIAVRQVVDYQLVDLQDDGVATIEMKLAQNGEPQTIQVPGLPVDLAVKMKYFTTRGRGRMKLSFDRLLPLSSNAALTSNAEMNVKVPGSNKELTTKIDTAINMSIRSQSPIIK